MPPKKQGLKLTPSSYKAYVIMGGGITPPQIGSIWNVFYTKQPATKNSITHPSLLQLFISYFFFFKSDFLFSFLFICKNWINCGYFFSVHFIFSKCEKAIRIFIFCCFSVIIFEINYLGIGMVKTKLLLKMRLF